MKKLFSLLFLLICVFGAIGCALQPDTEKWDLRPMVMVDGSLYLDTGMESSRTARPHQFDGQITSTVDSSEKPVVNGQSNFGADYGYQYGPDEGTIEIFIDNRWWIFAREEIGLSGIK